MESREEPVVLLVSEGEHEERERAETLSVVEPHNYESTKDLKGKMCQCIYVNGRTADLEITRCYPFVTITGGCVTTTRNIVLD